MVIFFFFRTFAINKNYNYTNFEYNMAYWKCKFKDNEGNLIQKFIIADTTRQAKQQVFETSRYFKLDPIYETLELATDKEIRNFKRMIKNRIKKRM